MSTTVSTAKPSLEHSSDGPDTVTDAYAWDNMGIIRDQIFVVSLQYKDVLDAEKLRDSLNKLIDRDGWRKVGGRLRQQVWQ
jgi:hypothetical protein